MKVKEKQRRKPDTLKKASMAASSSDEEDSDVEKNFALLTKRGEAGGAEEGDFEDMEGSETGEEEDDGGDDDSDGQEEEEEEEEEKEKVEGEEDSEASEEDEDSEDDDEDDGDEDLEEAGGSREIQTREDIKKELSNMSFEDVLKLQNKVGTKVYNQVAYGSSKSAETRKKQRPNKNRPMEVSSKRPVPLLRQVVAVKKPKFRDPRFDDLSGEYKPEIFEKTYKFIDDIKHREKQVVEKKLKKLKKLKKDSKKKEELQFLLKRMENQERAKKIREEQRERELQFKRQQRERANQGTQPFFLKKSDKKKLQLAEKYEELKKSGKLDNFLSKKRKRNAVKDRRKLPRHNKTAA